MSDLDKLLEELERVVVRALNTAASRGGTSAAEETFALNSVLTARVSAKVRFLDEYASRPSTDLMSVRGPVIDVFEEGRDLKILVHLPGVKKEDVVLLAGPRSLRIEIMKGGTKFSRDIPCGANLSRARVKSTVENNSVVEITLREVPGGRPR